MIFGTAYARLGDSQGFVLTLDNEMFAIGGYVYFAGDPEQLERVADYFYGMWSDAWQSQRLPN